jgi:zinc transport system substrate-binding protein
MRKLLELTLALALLAMACGGENAVEESGLTVLVSVVPQKYFVQRLAGDLAEVKVIIPPGASPAAYEPSPSDLTTVSAADLWFSVGLLAEQNWKRDFQEISPDLVIVETERDLERLAIDRYGLPGEHGEHHDHGHDHGDLDPHVWLSPAMVTVQIETMAEALIEADPDNAETYRGNLEAFRTDIVSLQADLHMKLDPLAGGSFMVFHPAWGYFADEFDLVQVPVEIAGSEPSPGEMSELVDHALEYGIQVIFVSPQFSTASAEAIAAEIGAEVAVLDPLAENWLNNMERAGSELQAALR